MAETQPYRDYRTPKSPKSEFILLGKTYVALYAVVAFEQGEALGTTRLYLDCGHVIVVGVPANKVRNIMETK